MSLLGILDDRAGPVGRALRDGIALAVGMFHYAVPFVLVWVGWSLLRSRETERSVRVSLGSACVFVAGLGLAHLARGPGTFDAPGAELRRGGGVLGAALAEPIRALVATPGAWIVCLLIGLFGLLVWFDLTLGMVADVLANAASTMFDVVSGWYEALVEPNAAPEPEIVLDLANDAAPEVVDKHEPEAGIFVAAPDDSNDKADKTAIEPKVNVPAPSVTKGEQLTIEMVDPATTKWKLPKPSVLGRSGAQTVDERAVHAAGRALEQALASHGVETKVIGMTVGPTVTRYELQLAPGVKVARVTSLNKDIAYAMASADVRILAPIPGRSAIGIEVPNDDRHDVGLGDILSSTTARDSNHPLDVALGQDIAGRPIMTNLAKMPHVLIAGATGAGKSSCINSILTSLLMRATPDQVRLILIDPKRVEMGQYDRLPHLLTQVVTNPKKAANALAWAVKEMEKRYDLLSECGFRDITGYNQAYDNGQLVTADGDERTYERIPFIVVVVDELNDLMMVAARDVEDSITRLAQMARAVGIHLVIATQRPSVNVITGVIKANIPSRMAFAVSSLADSRVILDQPGAERLIGKGDMLLLTANSNVPQRIQGCWVTEAEVQKVVAAWRRQAPDVAYVDGVAGTDEAALNAARLPGGTTGDESDDELLIKAIRLVVESQLGSTSMLQRKLKVGFARAGRLMDLMEQRGVVGPSIGSKARDVMVTVEELTSILPPE
ncbi:MAG: DNA translocase FtsK [Actinobacteria bacterium]|nr:DNA translocase FtsK [Actinomycetota bacterium]